MKNFRCVGVALVVGLSLSVGAEVALAGVGQPQVDDNPAVFLSPLRDEFGGSIFLPPDTPPETLLYIGASGEPLLTPDGDHVSLGEWIDFEGRCSLKCIPGLGTLALFKFDGLVPRGLYSIFLFVRESPSAPVGFGRLPSILPIESGSFTTTWFGDAHAVAIVPAGPLSFTGSAPQCLLDYGQVNIIFVYQVDGQLNGPVPGPPSVAVNHALCDQFD